MNANPIIETAARLRNTYGFEIRISYVDRVGEPASYYVSGGRHEGPEGPDSNCIGLGTTLEYAEADFLKGRDRLAKIDPLTELKKQAAAAGMELVPAGRAMDLQRSTAAQG